MFTGPNIVTDGLVLHLDAGNTKSYPGSGTTWFDKSGNENNGTLANGPEFSSANGGSIVFDGSNDYVILPDLVNIRLVDVTFSFTFKLNNTTSDGDLLNKGNHSTDAPLLIWFDKIVGGGSNIGRTNCISVLLYDGTNGFHWISTGSDTININTLYVLDVVIKPSTNELLLYLNGVLSNSNIKNYNGIQNSSNNFILGAAGNGGRNLSGNIYSYKSYNISLTSQEVLQNYNATKSRFNL